MRSSNSLKPSLAARTINSFIDLGRELTRYTMNRRNP